jgi:hypothetical protein
MLIASSTGVSRGDRAREHGAQPSTTEVPDAVTVHTWSPANNGTGGWEDPGQVALAAI